MFDGPRHKDAGVAAATVGERLHMGHEGEAHASCSFLRSTKTRLSAIDETTILKFEAAFLIDIFCQCEELRRDCSLELLPHNFP